MLQVTNSSPTAKKKVDIQATNSSLPKPLPKAQPLMAPLFCRKRPDKRPTEKQKLPQRKSPIAASDRQNISATKEKVRFSRDNGCKSRLAAEVKRKAKRNLETPAEAQPLMAPLFCRKRPDKRPIGKQKLPHQKSPIAARDRQNTSATQLRRAVRNQRRAIFSAGGAIAEKSPFFLLTFSLAKQRKSKVLAHSRREIASSQSGHNIPQKSAYPLKSTRSLYV
jgi:hypothetical protein